MGLDRAPASAPDLDRLAVSTHLSDHELYQLARFADAYLHLRAALAGLGAMALLQHTGTADTAVLRAAAITVAEHIDRARMACPPARQVKHPGLRERLATTEHLAATLAAQNHRSGLARNQMIDTAVLVTLAAALRAAEMPQLGVCWDNPMTHEQL